MITRVRKFIKILGPGFITGASDDDPAGIATYSQTGAIFGFSQAWTALFTTPLMAAVQEMAGKIGLVTGKGLAGVIRTHYSKKILYFSVLLLFIANTINIGADLGAMAASAQLIFNLPFIFFLLGFGFLTLLLEIFVSYKTYSKYLKFLTFSLFSYVSTAFIINVDWRHVLFSTLIPTLKFSKDYLFNIVAILGTTISPYLYFWQASEEVEEEVSENKIMQMGKGRPRVSSEEIKELSVDTVVGMIFSNLIMWFIIITTGATLYANGIHSIRSAQDAAQALRPLAGDFAFLLFALGIIGTGLLAVPILAGSASYAVSEAFGWKEGLYKKARSAPGFYAVIALATLLGILFNFFEINPIQALYYSAVINGLIATPILIMVFLISNNKKIMNHRVNNTALNILGIITIIAMSIASLALIFSLWMK